ncbi:MAG: MATE family efflux transporter [Clostridiales bacterium]|nr:MATE family efflux transporter [Clostridiales bacterium]
MNTTEIYYKKMTETPVAKLVIRLGIPTTVSMLITSIYNMADTYFVGTLGKSAQGAIGILFTLQSIIQAVAFMLGHGSGTYVSKELANKDVKKASAYVSSAFFLGGAIGLLFTAVGLLTLSPLMKLLGSTDTILPYAKQYGMWVLIACPFMICSLILNNNLRYEGKALYAMIGLVSGGILNMGMDFVFIRYCNLGVFGAGMATAISQIISFTILLILYFKAAQSKISFRNISKQFKLYLEIFRNGLPSLIRQGLNSISSGLLNKLAGSYGGQISAEMADAAIDAMTVVNRISNFVMCVGMGISQGLQPVASFNYQAKKYARVKKALLVTIFITWGCILVLAIPVACAPRFFVSLFQDEEVVLNFATPAMLYAMLGQIFVPLFIPLNMLFQSIRKSWMASFLALLRSGLLFIPILFTTTAIWGLTGIQISQPIADALTGLVSLPILLHFLRKTPGVDEPNEPTPETEITPENETNDKSA